MKYSHLQVLAGMLVSSIAPIILALNRAVAHKEYRAEPTRVLDRQDSYIHSKKLNHVFIPRVLLLHWH